MVFPPPRPSPVDKRSGDASDSGRPVKTRRRNYAKAEKDQFLTKHQAGHTVKSLTTGAAPVWNKKGGRGGGEGRRRAGEGPRIPAQITVGRQAHECTRAAWSGGSNRSQRPMREDGASLDRRQEDRGRGCLFKGSTGAAAASHRDGAGRHRASASRRLIVGSKCLCALAASCRRRDSAAAGGGRPCALRRHGAGRFTPHRRLVIVQRAQVTAGWWPHPPWRRCHVLARLCRLAVCACTAHGPTSYRSVLEPVASGQLVSRTWRVGVNVGRAPC